MSTGKPAPTLGKAGAGGREARRERLAAALRENLRKRKTQARGRALGDGASSSGPERPGGKTGSG